MPGNTQDVTTVEKLLIMLKKRFGVEKCLLVFDRGMVSADNLKAISGQSLTYISALDKDEVRTLRLLEPEFSELVAESGGTNLLALGFHAYDDNLFYREHLHQGHRYIIAFNRHLYREQQQSRIKRLENVKAFFVTYNEDLNRAQKSRNEQATGFKIEKHIRKLQLHKIFSWQLEPVVLTVQTAKGKERKLNSFRIIYNINETRLKEQEHLDGIMCFVTNEPNNILSSLHVISHYRRKNKIEDAFREIKSYLHLRPFHLTREKRVNAHVSICVLGYLLLNALEEKLSQLEQPLSGPTALEIFSKCQLNHLGPQDSSTYVESITMLTDEQAELLKNLGLEHLVGKKYLDKILEHFTM